MSVIIRSSGNIGPFKSVETLSDRLRCDGVDYPLTVLGSYSISEDDGLAPAPPVVLPTMADYDKAMTDLFDTTAQTKHYDNRITCALRAGYSGPFQPEGVAFAQWMDACNEAGYQIMAQVLAGQITQPSVAELLALFPAIVWP